MSAGARVTLKAFSPTLSRRSQSLSHFPGRCPGHCSNQTYFSERKPDPASCQCHQSHSIRSPLLLGMHSSPPFLFFIPLVSRQQCLGQSRGSVFGCPRSIHPLWWNRILGPPLCLLVSISGWCMIKVTDWKCGGFSQLGNPQRFDSATGFKCMLTVPQHFGILATSVVLSLFDCPNQVNWHGATWLRTMSKILISF